MVTASESPVIGFIVWCETRESYGAVRGINPLGGTSKCLDTEHDARQFAAYLAMRSPSNADSKFYIVPATVEGIRWHEAQRVEPITY